MKHLFSDVNAFRHDPLTLFMQKSRYTAMPLVKLNLGFKPVYLVTDPALIKPVMKAEEAQIDKGRLVQKLRTVIGKSSITMSGREHQERRAAIHQQLARGMMNIFVPEIASLIRQQAILLLQEKSFDAHGITAPLALRIITAILFGRDVLTRSDENALMEAVHVAEAEMADSLFRMLPRLPWTRYRKLKALRESRNLMSMVVNRVRVNAKSTSMLSALEKLGLSADDLRDEILLLLLAGHHTSGNAMAWILYFLATEPGLGEQVAHEAKSIVNEEGEIEALRLPRADLSLRIARETLRLYPPFYWLSREVKQPIELGGLKLSPGTSLIISTWQMQRDERFWESPEKFRLDRAYNSPAYLPFGTGPRACVGMGLGMLELQLFCLEMASAYEIQILSEVPAPLPQPAVTILPPAIKLSLIPRGKAAPFGSGEVHYERERQSS
jgi:cytochrome P450